MFIIYEKDFSQFCYITGFNIQIHQGTGALKIPYGGRIGLIRGVTTGDFTIQGKPRKG